MTIDFHKLAVAGVQSLHPYLPGKPIEELERELGVSNTLKLASNENTLGPSPKAIEAMQAAITLVALYPDGNGFVLKQKLAEQFHVDINGILLGNGSNVVLDLVARTFLQEGCEAIFSEYAFAVYPISTQAVGATARIAKALAPDHENAYGHDLEAMKALINEKTRVIFIANPNNPTGNFLKSDELHQFLTEVPKEVIVVVDEAYCEYVDKAEYPDAVSWLNEFPNLIVSRTFSKAYGLAGLRVGYAFCSDVIAGLLNRVRHPFNVNTISLLAATAALDDKVHLKQCVDTNTEGLAFWRSACESRNLEYIPTVGNFITIDFKQNAMPIYDALLHEAVIVRPIANYGLPNHLRISISTEEDNQKCLNALDKVMKALNC